MTSSVQVRSWRCNSHLVFHNLSHLEHRKLWCTSPCRWRSWNGLHTGSNSWSPANCRENIAPIVLQYLPLPSLVSRRHTRSSWTTGLTLSGHLNTHPANHWKPSVCTAGTGGNTYWMELLRFWHLELPVYGWRSIGCPHKVHGLHQLNTPSLDFAGKSLEGRLWHQWDVGSTYLGRRSRWSADERPTWYRISVGRCTPGCHVGSTPPKTSPSLLLSWWDVEHKKIESRCFVG